jgi:hypothetical protein
VFQAGLAVRLIRRKRFFDDRRRAIKELLPPNV